MWPRTISPPDRETTGKTEDSSQMFKLDAGSSYQVPKIAFEQKVVCNKPNKNSPVSCFPTAVSFTPPPTHTPQTPPTLKFLWLQIKLRHTKSLFSRQSNKEKCAQGTILPHYMHNSLVNEPILSVLSFTLSLFLNWMKTKYRK